MKQQPQAGPEADQTPYIRTFMIADLRGYTSFTLAQGDEAAAHLSESFMSVVSDIVNAHRGSLFGKKGDQTLAAFTSAREALRASVDLQRRLMENPIVVGQDAPTVGVGLDAGEAVEVEGGDYRGTALNLAARVCALAEGGQILASETVIRLARRVDDLSYVPMATRMLKGFDEETAVFEIRFATNGPPAPAVPAPGRSEPLQERPLPVAGFLGSAPATPLVGRQDEIDRLRATAEVTASGGSRCVLIEGDAGIGKTRLGQELHVTLRDRGFIVGVGRSFEQYMDVPYLVARDIFTAIFDACDRKIRESTPLRWPHLSPLLSDMSQYASAETSREGHEPILVYRAAAAFLAEVSAKQPVAALVDDIQWADASSIQTLYHVMRSAETRSLLIAGTVRISGRVMPSALGEFRRDVERDGLLETVSVQPLTRVEVGDLIADLVTEGTEHDGAVADLVFQHGEGNPYFSRQLATTLIQQDDAAGGTAELHTIPPNVQTLVEQRLTKLEPGALELMEAASVLGSEFHIDDLAAGTESSDDDIDRALRVCEDSGLIREIDTEIYAFDHSLTQLALYRRLTSRRRRRLHLAMAEALVSRADNREQRPAEIAAHFAKGHDAARAAAWWLEAGDKARAISGVPEARQCFEQAVGAAEELDDHSILTHAREGLGRTLNALSQYDEATEMLELADAGYAELADDVGRGRVAAELGDLYYSRGDTTRGLATLSQAIDRLNATERREVVVEQTDRGFDPLPELYAARGQILLRVGDTQAALESTEQAITLGQKFDDRHTVAWASMQRARILEGTGRSRDALAAAQDALPRAQAAASGDLIWYSASVLTGMYFVRAKLSEAKAMIDLGLETARRRGDPQYIAASLTDACRDYMLKGAWGLAQEALDSAGATVEAGDPVGEFIALLRLQLSVLTGLTEGLEGRAAEILSAARQAGNVDPVRRATFILAAIYVLTDRASLAAQTAEDLRSEQPELAARPEFVAQWATCAICGDADFDAETVDDAIRTAREDHRGLPLIDLLRIRGVLATRASGDGIGFITESVELAAASDANYHHAQCLNTLFWAHDRAGDTTAAEQARQAAAGLNEMLGIAPGIDSPCFWL